MRLANTSTLSEKDKHPMATFIVTKTRKTDDGEIIQLEGHTGRFRWWDRRPFVFGRRVVAEYILNGHEFRVGHENGPEVQVDVRLSTTSDPTLARTLQELPDR